MTESKGSVFIVDDDEAIRGSLSMLLRAYGYEPRAFESAEAFLAHCEQSVPTRCMAILDLSMPGMDGLALQEELSRRSTGIPIVFLSGGGDIPAAVDAVRHGAVDFVEKPVDTETLIDRVNKALEERDRITGDGVHKGLETRLGTLTPRERQVLQSIADGKTSKTAATELGISERTIELHRSRILKKMGVRNSTELLNRVLPSLGAPKNPNG